MKKILILSVAFFLVHKNSCFSKTICSYDDTPRLLHYNYDTSMYLKRDFNDSTPLYINKPLKTLIKKLEIKPFSYLYTGERTDSVRAISIAFSKDEILTKIVTEDAAIKYYELVIELQTPIPMNVFRIFCFQHGYLWNRITKNYLQSLIIKNFKFYAP